MHYDDALKKWGAAKIGTDADPEYSCYCSFYESPSANVKITDTASGRSTSISTQDFDFVTVLAEIVAAGDGTLTS